MREELVKDRHCDPDSKVGRNKIPGPGGEGVGSSLGSHGVARGSGWLGRLAHGSFCNNGGEGGGSWLMA